MCKPTPQEGAMSEVKTTFFVRPKTVWVLGHATSEEAGGSAGTIAEVESEARAVTLAQALVKATPGATLELHDAT
ncbi:Uncharacterised protein [Achromobacter denitrificans]|nr:hypothetical protein LMG1231_02483 [Achromobacter denitrificans]SUW33773.1 Uncharacterised protein [Achromobacter denitrificans]